MNFDADGISWHIKEITDSIRELFADQVEKPEDLSSYSWRRWAPSVAHLLKFDPQQLSALGDWQDKKEIPTQAAMPLHYSGVRYIQSVKAKHAVFAHLRWLRGVGSDSPICCRGGPVQEHRGSGTGSAPRSADFMVHAFDSGRYSGQVPADDGSENESCAGETTKQWHTCGEIDAGGLEWTDHVGVHERRIAALRCLSGRPLREGPQLSAKGSTNVRQ